MSKIMTEDQCIRLYNNKGKHVVSLLHCCECDERYDLVLPDGKAEYCGVETTLIETLAKLFGVTNIEDTCRQALNINWTFDIKFKRSTGEWVTRFFLNRCEYIPARNYTDSKSDAFSTGQTECLRLNAEQWLPR